MTQYHLTVWGLEHVLCNSFSQQPSWYLAQRKYSIIFSNAFGSIFVLGKETEVRVCLYSIIVDFMCQLDCLSYAQIAGKILFLGVCEDLSGSG